jgi:SAM-dependent methyltransferase
MPDAWYEDDAFWVSMSTALFDAGRLAGTVEEVDAVADLTGMVPGMRVLDLCCGPGRHSVELARRGMLVTGVDRTRPYLRRARRKAAREGLEIDFVEQDMREPLGQARYDVALNMFTSFGYFASPSDDLRVAANLRRALKPGGVLLMDTIGKEILARGWQPRDWAELPEGGFLLQQRHLSQGWSWIENRWVLIREGQVEEYTIGHRLYAASELAGLLRSVGFASVQIFGSLRGDPYDELCQRLVLVAHTSGTDGSEAGGDHG